MNRTPTQYKAVINECRNLFLKKNHDYGTAWRVLRVSSLTDQIFIKANRIRTIQEAEVRKVDEGERNEFIGIINYCVMALIQLDGDLQGVELDEKLLSGEYDRKVQMAFDLMEDKNHDYGEAWRDMRVSSITDLILMKLLRVKQIEDNKGKTLVSEGLEANYLDMLNYAVFAMILLSEQTEAQ